MKNRWLPRFRAQEPTPLPEARPHRRQGREDSLKQPKIHRNADKFAQRAAKLVFFAGIDIAQSKKGFTAPTRSLLEEGGMRRTESYKRLRTLKMSHIGLFELYFCRLRLQFHLLLSGI